MAENKKSVKLEVASSDLQSKSKVTSRDLKDKGTVISGNQYTLEMVQSHIYTIRGQQVMIDRDLAFLYSVETRALNQAVKRNIERFPERYMFQLTKDEFNTLRSQIATSNNDWAILKSQNVISSWGGIRKMPYAFTEYGVTMLASVLKSKSAVDVSIRIIDAFVAMRRFISANANKQNMEIKKQITICKKHSNIMIYPESKNEIGLWIAHPPCYMASVSDVSKIENIISAALQHSNSGIPVNAETAKSVLKDMRIKNWNSLYKSYKIISYSVAEKKIIITPFVYTNKGVFPDSKAKKTFDIDDCNNVIGLLLRL